MNYRDEYHRIWADELDRLIAEQGSRLYDRDKLDHEARGIAERAVNELINRANEAARA